MADATVSGHTTATLVRNTTVAWNCVPAERYGAAMGMTHSRLAAGEAPVEGHLFGIEDSVGPTPTTSSEVHRK
jgi:hypothetical protein